MRIRIRLDPNHFGKLDPDPHPHQREKLDPYTHQSEKQDPDPHQSEQQDPDPATLRHSYRLLQQLSPSLCFWIMHHVVHDFLFASHLTHFKFNVFLIRGEGLWFTSF
jgi:hypothetical protein